MKEVIAMAHVINQMMRKEDLCGRTGHFQFVIVLSGTLSNSEKLLERIRSVTNIEFSSAQVQWALGEISLQLLYRLDVAAELTI